MLIYILCIHKSILKSIYNNNNTNNTNNSMRETIIMRKLKLNNNNTYVGYRSENTRRICFIFAYRK